MDFFTRCEIIPYINAHDTYTVYGGSRMSENTAEAMRQVSRHFVNIEQMQRTLGKKLAVMTQNEAAYITNGASGGMLLATAVCMAQSDVYRYSKLPETMGFPNEVIVMRAQRNAYDKAITAAGAQLIEVGDADETLAFELEGSIHEKTAAIFYFASTLYSRGSMPLQETIAIAHRHHVPVIVDAAAQLPPVENLWKFTQMGADLVIFSGGKTLCGPQNSGLMVGRKDMIEDCIRFGAPVHGICRSSKVSREAMAGLFVAVEEYLQMNQTENTARLLHYDISLSEAIEKTGAASCEIVPYGPVGQTYPRVFAFLNRAESAEQVRQEMLARHIYIGTDCTRNAIYISPLNLNKDELQIVMRNLVEVLQLVDTKEGNRDA
ncbi:MAG: aminotransferase class V-fold PLP-dependent enzyme [Ruthenibacterium sp.]